MPSKLSDAEVLEFARKHANDITVRVAVASVAGASDQEAAEASGRPRVVVTLFASDIREIGVFEVDVDTVPRHLRRAWVYRSRKSDDVFMLSWQKRLELQQTGSVQIFAYKHDDQSEAN